MKKLIFLFAFAFMLLISSTSALLIENYTTNGTVSTFSKTAANKEGWEIVPTYDIYITGIVTLPGAADSRAYIYDNSNVLLDNATISSGQANFFRNITLQAGQTYKVLTNGSATTSFVTGFDPFPSSKPVNFTITASYDNSGSRVTGSELYGIQSVLYSPYTVVPADSGIYVTFQIINPAMQPLSNVSIQIRSSTSLVEPKTTDDSGGATFFLDPTISYTITASRVGYATTTTSIVPTQSQYTISMGATSTTSNDYTRGVSISILPVGSSLINRTVYDFNYTISSVYWNLDSYGYSISNGTVTTYSASDTTTMGGRIAKQVDTSNNKTIVMNYYYIINGTYMNYTKTWIVLDLEGSQYSLLRLFSDLKMYLLTGMFGLTNFGMIIIIFLTIFVITGVFSYKFGLTSPLTISFLILALVLFFDSQLGLGEMVIPSAPYLPTLLMALMFIVVFIKEAVQ